MIRRVFNTCVVQCCIVVRRVLDSGPCMPTGGVSVSTWESQHQKIWRTGCALPQGACVVEIQVSAQRMRLHSVAPEVVPAVRQRKTPRTSLDRSEQGAPGAAKNRGSLNPPPGSTLQPVTLNTRNFPELVFIKNSRDLSGYFAAKHP